MSSSYLFLLFIHISIIKEVSKGEKNTSVFFHGSFHCPILWHLFLFISSRKSYSRKRKLKEGISENELVKLTFSKKEIPTLLKWENDKEFEYNGQMYDVVEVADIGDSLQYTCWWDKAETATKKNKHILLQAGIDSSNPENHLPSTFSDYYK